MESSDGVLHLEADDPRVEPYRNLKERDLAGRGELFILEGENSVHNLVQHGRMPLESVCISEKRVGPMQALIKVVRAQGVPVYALSHEAYSGIVGFNFHRGVLACGRKLPSASPRELLDGLPPSDASTIVLCEQTNNLDNVGAMFRNAAAFGARAVVFDGRSADPYYRKSIRVSGGHALVVPFTRSGAIADVVAAAKATGHTVCALVTPSDSDRSKTVDAEIGAPVPINEWRVDSRPRRVAVLMGAEGPGLSDDAQRLADVRLTIPMAGTVDSVNVATACSIALHELASTPARRSQQARKKVATLAWVALGVAAGAALARRRPTR